MKMDCDMTVPMNMNDMKKSQVSESSKVTINPFMKEDAMSNQSFTTADKVEDRKDGDNPISAILAGIVLFAAGYGIYKFIQQESVSRPALPASRDEELSRLITLLEQK